MARQNTHEKYPLEKQKWAYPFVNWATGPTVVNATVWTPALLALAAADSVCGKFDGMSSGVDGQMCTLNNAWNDTLFQGFNGAACEEVTPLGETVYKYLSNPTCQTALQQYRRAAGWTCNCTGDYSFLGGTGGMRPGMCV